MFNSSRFSLPPIIFININHPVVVFVFFSFVMLLCRLLRLWLHYHFFFHFLSVSFFSSFVSFSLRFFVPFFFSLYHFYPSRDPFLFLFPFPPQSHCPFSPSSVPPLLYRLYIYHIISITQAWYHITF